MRAQLSQCPLSGQIHARITMMVVGGCKKILVQVAGKDATTAIKLQQGSTPKNSKARPEG